MKGMILAVFLAVGCGGGGGDGGDGKGNGANLTQQEACEIFAPGWCDVFMRCNPTAFASRAECDDYTMHSCCTVVFMGACEDKEVDVTADDLAGCRDAWSASSCTDTEFPVECKTEAYYQVFGDFDV